MTSKPIGVAALGLGNVGSEVVRIITENAADFEARIGAPLEIRGIAVRRIDGAFGDRNLVCSCPPIEAYQ